jgi:hypothetical protein
MKAYSRTIKGQELCVCLSCISWMRSKSGGEGVICHYVITMCTLYKYGHMPGQNMSEVNTRVSCNKFVGIDTVCR